MPASPLARSPASPASAAPARARWWMNILRRALFRKFFGSKSAPGVHRALKGFENLDKVIVIDQTPIGRHPPQQPGHLHRHVNHIRDLLRPAARRQDTRIWIRPFSFNVKGGRCEKCQGDGLIKIENALPAAGVRDLRSLQWPPLQP